MTQSRSDIQKANISVQERVRSSADHGERKRMNPTPGVRFLQLELRHELPDVYSAHGRALAERRSGAIRFHQTTREGSSGRLDRGHSGGGSARPPREVEWLYIPLFVAFFPFWLPGGVLTAILAFGAARRFARCGPLTSEDVVVIRTHPAFAAALGDRNDLPER